MVNLCNKMTTDCQTFLEAVSFLMDNTFIYLRVYQQNYLTILRSQTQSDSSAGETKLYIISSACIGTVLLSLAVISQMFIWVIKDKSYVLRIFGDILDSEIHSMIALAEACDFKCIKYKRKWLAECHGDEEKFWDKVQKEQKKNEKDNIVVVESQNPIPSKIVSISMGTVKESEKLVPKSDDSKVEEQKNEMEPEAKPDENEPKVAFALEDMQKKKSNEKKNVLTQLEYVMNILNNSSKIRNTAIIRLIIVLAVFLAYAGVSIYFNYYFHSFNQDTIDQFNVLNFRGLYPVYAHSIIRYSIEKLDKEYLFQNTSKLYILFLIIIRRGWIDV